MPLVRKPQVIAGLLLLSLLPGSAGFWDRVEVGVITATNNWQTISVGRAYTNPVLVAGIPTFNSETSEVIVRTQMIANTQIGGTSFRLKLQTPTCNIGEALQEEVSWMIMEAQAGFAQDDGGGTGTNVQAGRARLGSESGGQVHSHYVADVQVPFNTSFQLVNPVVVAFVMSFNGSDYVTVRAITHSTYFQVWMQEEESIVNYQDESAPLGSATPGLGGGYHEMEDIGWLAVSAGHGSQSMGYQWWASKQHGDFDNFLDVQVNTPFYSAAPHIFGSIMGLHGWNPCHLRHKPMPATCSAAGTSYVAVSVRVEEDQCHDNEQYHVNTDVGVILLRAPAATCGGVPVSHTGSISITVDNYYYLYLNGVLQSPGMGNGAQTDWHAADIYTFANLQSPLVIAIDGENSGGPAGILATVEIDGVQHHSNTSWKCFDPATGTPPAGWNRGHSATAQWPSAVSHGTNGVGPWGNIAGIGGNAQWVWTNNFYGRSAYCVMTISPSCSQIAANLTAGAGHACPAGSYHSFDTASAMVCTECPPDTYSNVSCATTCTHCPQGWAAPAGSTSSSACTPCPVGTRTITAADNNDPACSTVTWERIFRQTLPFVQPAAAWESYHPTSTDDPNFSALSTLEHCRAPDGKFHLKIVWPRSGSVPNNFNEWKQTNNPLRAGEFDVTGYEPIAINFAGTQGSEFHGLEHAHSTAHALLDGSPGTRWWYAIGISRAHSGGIPAGNGTHESQVELYAMCPPAACDAYTSLSNCAQCDVGRYSSASGVTSCTACQQGWTALAGSNTSAACFPCPAGKLRSSSAAISHSDFQWEPLLRQTMPFVQPTEIWKSYNPANNEDPNFSRLTDLESCRGLDGKLHLKLVWPNSVTAPNNFNEWKQSNNPMLEGQHDVTGYEPVAIHFTNNNWGGMQNQGSRSSLLDGSMNVWWWYAIGTSKLYGGGIPGGNGHVENVTELWGMCPHPGYDTGYDGCMPCEVGKYAGTAGATVCTPCAVGQTAPQGARACQPKPASAIEVGDQKAGVACRDRARGTGFIMFSAANVHSRFSNDPVYANNANHLVCVVHDPTTGAWSYDNNARLTNFTPSSTDVLLARVDFTADTVQSTAGSDAMVGGLQLGYSAGDISFVPNTFNGMYQPGEFSLSQGSYFVPAGVTLPPPPQPVPPPAPPPPPSPQPEPEPEPDPWSGPPGGLSSVVSVTNLAQAQTEMLDTVQSYELPFHLLAAMIAVVIVGASLSRYGDAIGLLVAVQFLTLIGHMKAPPDVGLQQASASFDWANLRYPGYRLQPFDTACVSLQRQLLATISISLFLLFGVVMWRQSAKTEHYRKEKRLADICSFFAVDGVSHTGFPLAMLPSSVGQVGIPSYLAKANILCVFLFVQHMGMCQAAAWTLMDSTCSITTRGMAVLFMLCPCLALPTLCGAIARRLEGKQSVKYREFVPVAEKPTKEVAKRWKEATELSLRGPRAGPEETAMLNEFWWTKGKWHTLGSDNRAVNFFEKFGAVFVHTTPGGTFFQCCLLCQTFAASVVLTIDNKIAQFVLLQPINASTLTYLLWTRGLNTRHITGYSTLVVLLCNYLAFSWPLLDILDVTGPSTVAWLMLGTILIGVIIKAAAEIYIILHFRSHIANRISAVLLWAVAKKSGPASKLQGCVEKCSTESQCVLFRERQEMHRRTDNVDLFLRLLDEEDPQVLTTVAYMIDDTILTHIQQCEAEVIGPVLKLYQDELQNCMDRWRNAHGEALLELGKQWGRSAADVLVPSTMLRRQALASAWGNWSADVSSHLQGQYEERVNKLLSPTVLFDSAKCAFCLIVEQCVLAAVHNMVLPALHKKIKDMEGQDWGADSLQQAGEVSTRIILRFTQHHVNHNVLAVIDGGDLTWWHGSDMQQDQFDLQVETTSNPISQRSTNGSHWAAIRRNRPQLNAVASFKKPPALPKRRPPPDAPSRRAETVQLRASEGVTAKVEGRRPDWQKSGLSVAQRAKALNEFTVEEERSGGGANISTAAEIFDRVDTDGSDSISFQEFARWWSGRQMATSSKAMPLGVLSEIRQLWQEFDVDGSGDLDREEFDAVLTTAATSDWKEAYDAQRDRVYYYNAKTKVTKWSKPEDNACVTEFLKDNKIVVDPSSSSIAVSTSQATLEQMREALREHIKSQSNMSPADSAEMLEIIATEDDRQTLLDICAEEGIATMTTTQLDSYGSTPTAEVFRAVDLDGSGSISREEFARYFAETQLATKGEIDADMMAQMDAAWAEADADGSGDLDLGEFATVLTSMAESQWRPVHDTATGRTYYFHSKTKETKWVKPDSKTSVDSFLQSEGLIANEDTI